ncbi:MAG: hypothetical protein AABY84_05765 [Candidatus Firestonebacteria bacterium]
MKTTNIVGFDESITIEWKPSKTDEYSFIINIYSAKDKFVGEEELPEFNERQKKAIEYVKKKGSISRKEYKQLNGISHTIAHKELKNLAEKDIFKIQGAGKYLRYGLTQG